MKVRKNTSPTSDKECLRITHFRYTQAPSLKKAKSKNNSPNHIPIRTLVQKMSSAQDPLSQSPTGKTSILINESFHKNAQSQYKTFLVPRDSMYVAKPQMFNRYNYQNYNGYQYKNPFRPPQKYPIQDRVLGKATASTHLKVNPSHGTSKNLQIVFCEHKYKDFVEKTNQQVRKVFQQIRKNKTIDGRIRKRSSEVNLGSRRSSATIGSNKNEMMSKLRKSLTLGKKKTTLSNYLQQFNTLQKLSKYMQRQHKLNEKYLFLSSADNSRTVLLDILIHRFSFLKGMKKKARDIIFEILLGIQEVNNYYKINIQQYIKFNQIFISRDAEPGLVAMFIFAFLFKKIEQTTKEALMKSMSLLEGSAKLHQFVEDYLLQIVQVSNQNSRQIYQRITNDEIIKKAFIDLILEHQ